MHPRGGTADLRWLRFLVGPHSGPLLLTAPVPPALGRTRMLGQECRRRVVGRAGFGDLAGEGASGRQAPSVVAMIQSPPSSRHPWPVPPSPAGPSRRLPRPASRPGAGHSGPPRSSWCHVSAGGEERRRWEGGGRGRTKGASQRSEATKARTEDEPIRNAGG
jgi:hypothetical protein